MFVAALSSLHAVYNMTPFGSVVLANKLDLTITNIFSLGCNNNDLHGAVPDALGFIRSLEFLELAHNELRGTLPGIIASLRRLRAIVADRNDLSGALPASVGFLTEIFDLNVEENRMEGAIPDALELLRGLLGVFLGHNAFSSSIPKAFSRWGRLGAFHAGRNRLEGSIPSCVSGLGKETVHHPAPMRNFSWPKESGRQRKDFRYGFPCFTGFFYLSPVWKFFGRPAKVFKRFSFGGAVHLFLPCRSIDACAAVAE